MKRMSYLMMMVFLVSLFLGMSTDFVMAQDKKALMKITLAFPSSIPVMGEAIQLFKKEVELVTNGTVEVKIYEPGKLVPAYQIHDAVSKGEVTAGYTCGAYVIGKVPAAVFFCSFPFAPDIDQMISWYYYGNGTKLMQETYDKANYNVKALPFTFLVPETSGWFKKEIKSAEDFKGLKIRYGGLAGNVMNKLGAAATSIPGGEVYPALEKGTLDAAEFAIPSADTSLGFYRVAKFNYFPAWHQPATHLELVINKDFWNGLSSFQQKGIELAARSVTLFSLAKGTATQAEVLRTNATKHGVKNMTWSPDMLDLFKEKWEESVAEFIAKDDQAKRVYSDITKFQEDNKLWFETGYLPRKR